MLRIHVSKTASETTLCLEGRVIGPWVEELKQSCEGVLVTGTRLALDLADVLFVGREGLELFRTLMRSDVKLLNCSPFVSEQLKG